MKTSSLFFFVLASAAAVASAQGPRFNVQVASTPSDDVCLERLYNGVRKVISAWLAAKDMDVSPMMTEGGTTIIPCGMVGMVRDDLVSEYNEAGCDRGFAEGNAVFEARALSVLKDLLVNPEDCPVFHGVDETVSANLADAPSEAACTPEEEYWSLSDGANACLMALMPEKATPENACTFVADFFECFRFTVDKCYNVRVTAEALMQQYLAFFGGLMSLFKTLAAGQIGPGQDLIDLLLNRCYYDVPALQKLAGLDLDRPLLPANPAIIAEAMNTTKLMYDEAAMQAFKIRSAVSKSEIQTFN